MMVNGTSEDPGVLTIVVQEGDRIGWNEGRPVLYEGPTVREVIRLEEGRITDVELARKALESLGQKTGEWAYADGAWERR